MLDRSDRKRQQRAASHKRTRLRRKLGVVSVPVDIDSDIIGVLVKIKQLEDGVTDRRMIGEAVTRTLRDAAKN